MIDKDCEARVLSELLARRAEDHLDGRCPIWDTCPRHQEPRSASR